MNSPNQHLAVRSLHFSGWLLVVSGIAHLALFVVSGGDWEGDTSLRKPILFGVSAGATLLSIGWLVPKLRPRLGDKLLWMSFSLAMTIEVTLITLQQWRGVPSHFNRSTTLDATILNVIESLILLVTVVITDLTWRSWRRLDASSDMKVAIRGGMSLLFVGCVLGILSTIYGAHQQSIGKPPGIYGEAGVMKFAHGMPLHAIQFLPAIAWILAKFNVIEKQRTRVVLLCLCSLITLTIFSCVQTFSGRSRFDLNHFSISLVALAVVLVLLGPAAILARQLTTK